MNTDTPETDAEILQILIDRGVVDHRNAPENLVNKSRSLERERNNYKRTLEKIAGASAFDNINGWARNVAKDALHSLHNAESIRAAQDSETN